MQEMCSRFMGQFDYLGTCCSFLESIDRDVIARLVSRCDAITKSASASGFLAASLALASVPVALGAFAGEAFGKSSRFNTSRDIITDVLNCTLPEVGSFRGVNAATEALH